MPRHGDARPPVEASSILEHSLLDTIVPIDADFTLNGFLDTSTSIKNVHNASFVSHVPQRLHVYLDEVLTIYALLRSPFVDEETSKAFLQRLHLTLETYAVGTAYGQEENNEPGAAQTKDLIHTRVISVDENEPVIAVHSEDEAAEEGPGRFIYALWRTDVHITRADVHSSDPSIYCAASMRLRRAPNTTLQDSDDEYLESGVPASTNLLAALQDIPEYRRHPPTLTVARLSKVVPAGTALRDQTKVLRNSTRRQFPLRPAVDTKILFQKVGTSPSRVKMLASLNVEISPYVDRLDLEDVGLDLLKGLARLVGAPPSLRLPLTCRGRDSLSFVYDLLPKPKKGNTMDGLQPIPHTVTLNLKAFVHLSGPDDQDEDLSVPIRIAWRTSVDLTPLTRPLRLSGSPTTLNTSDTGPSSSPEQSHPRSMSSVYSSYLVTLTISGPSTSYLRGPPIQWSLLLANRSTKRTLNLALIPLTTHPPPSAPSRDPAASTIKGHKHKATLSASLFAAPNAGTTASSSNATANAPPHPQPAPDLIPLTPDIRIGPLSPGQSTTAEMKFLPLKSGVLRVRAIRIVDLDRERGKPGGSKAEQQVLGTKKAAPGQSELVAGGEGQEKVWMDVEGEMLPDIVVEEGEGRDGEGEDGEEGETD
ncbi:MAG: hypothetical protein M1828_002755 [Chrysothrix sp. TS-e1954]|nr:MAG: hypothetical protein M1828_002755 [Chrysothrix sp. TS-e1954]